MPAFCQLSTYVAASPASSSGIRAVDDRPVAAVLDQLLGQHETLARDLPLQGEHDLLLAPPRQEREQDVVGPVRRDVHAAVGECPPRAHERVLADRVQDDVVALAAPS